MSKPISITVTDRKTSGLLKPAIRRQKYISCEQEVFTAVEVVMSMDLEFYINGGALIVTSVLGVIGIISFIIPFRSK